MARDVATNEGRIKASAKTMRITDTEVERYARQLVLHEIGGAGQQALKRARVLVVGLGGLGLPAAAYLAGAGVGRLGLVDPDTVAVSNLHRQILFQTADIGLAKTDVAAARLLALNPYLEIDLYPERFEAAADIVGSHVRHHDTAAARVGNVRRKNRNVGLVRRFDAGPHATRVTR